MRFEENEPAHLQLSAPRIAGGGATEEGGATKDQGAVKDVHGAQEARPGKTHSREYDVLPPILLTVALPAGYPSSVDAVPSFSIKSQWLPTLLLTQLAHELQDLWDANPGQEILFEWVDYLASHPFEKLEGISGIFRGQQGGEESAADTDAAATTGVLFKNAYFGGEGISNSQNGNMWEVECLAASSMQLMEALTKFDTVKSNSLWRECPACMDTKLNGHVNHNYSNKLAKFKTSNCSGQRSLYIKLPDPSTFGAGGLNQNTS